MYSTTPPRHKQCCVAGGVGGKTEGVSGAGDTTYHPPPPPALLPPPPRLRIPPTYPACHARCEGLVAAFAPLLLPPRPAAFPPYRFRRTRRGRLSVTSPYNSLRASAFCGTHARHVCCYLLPTYCLPPTCHLSLPPALHLPAARRATAGAPATTLACSTSAAIPPPLYPATAAISLLQSLVYRKELVWAARVD